MILQLPNWRTPRRLDVVTLFFSIIYIDEMEERVRVGPSAIKQLDDDKSAICNQRENRFVRVREMEN